MSNLDEQLADLAQQLGISVGELWSWLQTTGINELIKAKTAYLATVVVLSAISVAVGLMALRAIIKSVGNDDFDDFDEVLAGVGSLFALAAVVFGLAIFLSSAPGLVAWLVSPQGRVLDMLLD